MLSLSLLFVAAAAVSAQSSQSSGCTSKSFSIPSWLIDNFQTAAGKSSFHITNRAINYTADLTCSGTTCTSANTTKWSNDTLQVSVQVSGETAEFLVNQTWTCNDRSATKALPFTAFGNGSLSVGDNLPLLIKGSLLSPVTITPQYASGPTGHSNPGCAAAPKWSLSAPFYTNQTGDGITAIAFQDFNVLLMNTATGYEASCMSGAGFGDGLTPTPATGPLNLVCAGYEFQSSNGGRYGITTAASFDPSTFTFNVNQTWYCDDVSAAKPVQITASASQVLPLTCTASPVTVDGEPDGNTKTSCINRADVTVVAQHSATTPLAPYSIEDPVPGADACTLSSIFHPQWTFSAFGVENNKSVSFEIILRTGSPGFQFPISITQDGDACVVGAGGNIGPPLWPTACRITYEPTKQQLTLKAEWSCSELDPDHPIYFSGTTITTVNSPLTCETVDGVSQCVTEDGGYQWTADISNVTWH
ncbi:hypothetical protein GE09DRAFT_1178205 [Coniochaeta sp. 2T2.1]|nr:hypothetical protein GE09DRAFT_1178205 [Coniochaeta sp. 2T2.1]